MNFINLKVKVDIQCWIYNLKYICDKWHDIYMMKDVQSVWDGVDLIYKISSPRPGLYCD